MALDATRLALAYKTVFLSIGSVAGPNLDTLCNGLAAAVVTELTSNGEVNPTGVPPLTAPPGGGPVTGKGTIG